MLGLPVLSFVSGVIGVNVTSGDIVNVAVPDYVDKVRRLLAKTPARVLANYMVWGIVKSSVNYLNKQALAHKLQYNKILTGKSKHSPRNV